MDVHCEGEGGTGSASNKGYSNVSNHDNCYSFATYHSNKSVLKASERVDALSPVPTDGIVT